MDMMAVQRYGLDVIWDNHTIPDMEAIKGGLSRIVMLSNTFLRQFLTCSRKYEGY